MYSYKTVYDGMAIEVFYRSDEVRRYVTVKDLMTGKEFSGNYPKGFEVSEIVELIVDQAVSQGEM